MSLKLIRIHRLKRFIVLRDLDGPVQLGKAIGKSASQASDLLTGKASFGEKVARSIEEFAQLPTNWLDTLEDASIGAGSIQHRTVTFDSETLIKACNRSAPQICEILEIPPRKYLGEKLAAVIEKNLRLDGGGLSPSGQTAESEGTSPEEDLFIALVKREISSKSVPSHMMQTIVSILANAPRKS